MASDDPLSPDRLAALDVHLTGLVEEGPLPHVQFLAARDGEVLHRFGAGIARADDTPLEEDALYRIASMTKPVTAVLAMMLVEEGRLSLDDPVARYLPELADLEVYEDGRVPPFGTRSSTHQPHILDLFRHTAGFTYGIQQQSVLDQEYWKAGLYNYKARVTREGMLAALAGLPLAHDPGSRFTYSVSTDLLGIIVERICDQSLSELFKNRIFEPLGMGDSFFEVPPEKQARLTDSWAMLPRVGRRLYDPAEGSLWTRPPSFESGGGGLVSSAADYHRFCRMLLNGGTLDGERLLKPETVALMTRNHLPGGATLAEMANGMFRGAEYRHTGCGLGFAVTLEGDDNATPAGALQWPGFFSTWFSVVPSERLILIFMTQLIPASEQSFAPAVHRILFG
jgi:CubicO group peptidase (beta-lactamase class C family)